MSERSLLKATGTLASATLLSRITGFLRDLLFAFFFGTGDAAAAFIVAFRIPNLLRRLFAEGMLSAAFVPLYTRTLKEKGRDEADRMASVILNALAVVLVGVVVAGITFAPFIVRVFTLDFSPATPRLKLTISLTRITFPFIFLIGIASIMMGVLNAHKHFLVPALAPVVLNLTRIAFLASLLVFVPPFKPVYWVAFGVLVGGVFQILMQIPVLRLYKFSYTPVLDFTSPYVKRVVDLMIPGVVGLAVAEVNVMVDTFLAWHIGSYAVGSLYYANLLTLLPVGIIGVSFGTALLPSFSGFAVEEKWEELKRYLGFSLSSLAFFASLFVYTYVFFGDLVIKLLFQRGAFKAASTGHTYFALIFYSTGIFAYMAVKSVISAFYSLHDTRTPMKIGVYAMLLNIVLNFIFVVPLRQGGLALATSLSSWFNFFVLLRILSRRLGGLKLSGFLKYIFVPFLSLPIFMTGLFKVGLFWRLGILVLCCAVHMVLAFIFKHPFSEQLTKLIVHSDK